MAIDPDMQPLLDEINARLAALETAPAGAEEGRAWNDLMQRLWVERVRVGGAAWATWLDDLAR